MTAPLLNSRDAASAEAFISANTRLISPPLVPELKLHLAEESLPIWQKTEDELQEINIPPPFWAFAWAGGQALARYLFDNPSLTNQRRVLDLGTGSGLTAIAAALCGASYVLAADIDRLAVQSAALNAAKNGVAIEVTDENLLLVSPKAGFDVVLVGDLFYEKPLADKVLVYLEGMRAFGATVLIGDPKRSYFPKERFTQVAEYGVPVTRELEDAEIKRTSVWRF